MIALLISLITPFVMIDGLYANPHAANAEPAEAWVSVEFYTNESEYQLTESEATIILYLARWEDDRIDEGLSVMWCESRGIPTRVNPTSNASGLFNSFGTWKQNTPRVTLMLTANTAIFAGGITTSLMSITST